MCPLLSTHYDQAKHNLTLQRYVFGQFHEVSANKQALILGNDIVVVKHIDLLVKTIPAVWTAATSFFRLRSNGNDVDYSDFFEAKDLDTGLYRIWSDVPSVHSTSLKIEYDLTTFFTNTNADVLKAAVTYWQISPK